MMMIVNTDNSLKDFKTLSGELEQIGEEIGVIIRLQKEEIFDMMHRI
jgi:ACT domain-containing protein